MEDYEAAVSLNELSMYLCRYYGKEVIILLDEYDTPMQEAYVNGYWEELTSFIRSLFNLFKTNPYLERAIMTEITRVSKASIFSDLNNPEVVTVTSNKYADRFGFTEEEVFAAMDECGRKIKETVKDGMKVWALEIKKIFIIRRTGDLESSVGQFILITEKNLLKRNRNVFITV